MDLIGKIKRLHSRDKKSEREISRMTGLSRNTVAKWLKEAVREARAPSCGEVPVLAFDVVDHR